MGKLQLSLLDMFWVTALIACIIGAVTTRTAEIAWIGVASVLFFVWHRPVLLRFWTIAMVGIGAGLWVVGANDDYALTMDSSDLIAWGVALVLGGFVAFGVFDIRKPPVRE